jgi:hypothetical protein
VSDASRPSLKRIHADETLLSGVSRFSLAYWRQRTTEEIVESLRPGKTESLKVKPDGRVLDGNVHVKVLEERSYDVDSLEREIV